MDSVLFLSFALGVCRYVCHIESTGLILNQFVSVWEIITISQMKKLIFI